MPRGLRYVLQYHLERPLQIESVLDTPMLFGKLIGVGQASRAYSHGSNALAARGARVAADLSGGLTLLAVAGIYLLIWRRRARVCAATPEQAIAALALILAVMTFGMVLSPQYFIWVLRAWALVAARDYVLAVLGGLTLLLTGIEFPKLCWNMLSMQHGPLAVLTVRNVMLVATF